MSSKPKILVACKDPGGAEALSPVVLKLISEGEVEITSIGYKFSEDVFKKRKIPFKKLEDFNITEISPTTMEYLLDKEKPDLVVLGTSLGRSIEDDIVLAARKMKIKTFALLDFWNNYSQRFSCLETNKRLAFLPDFIGVMDEFTKEEMIKEGFEPERLLITGQPYFDGLFELAKTFDKEKVIQFRDELNISNSDILISFFSQPLTKTRPNSADEPGYLGYTQLTILNSLIKALYILKKDLGRPITLFVKLHPKETPDEIDDLISGKTIGIAVDKNIDPRKLMLSSDIVCGMFTMILVEAFLIRKKVLSIQI
ncbi:MAG: hypothetical protein FJZ16_10210, partial [Candidatus Omnitrophica bacterium]|nr:hypothetical protein [Candidatus Omnitrophota bacterium]